MAGQRAGGGTSRRLCGDGGVPCPDYFRGCDRSPSGTRAKHTRAFNSFLTHVCGSAVMSEPAYKGK